MTSHHSTFEIPSDPSPASELQRQLADILDEYLTSVEEGVPVDVEEFVARYPEFAAPLREYLGGLALLRDGVSELRFPPCEDSTPTDPTPNYLVDYELIREVGRGGMGIVFEARQISLDRKVAIKMLPFAAVLDPKQVLRFQNEARAAAQLQHPHIVPIYSVGVDRGVHYYAMQFIEGRSLKQVVDELRQWDKLPACHDDGKTRQAGSLPHLDLRQAGSLPHFVADLGIQAAEALHAAHECGVIHRDIKPSNLLLDQTGKLWIADFGLARCRTGTGISNSGDVIGTLHYMSPEQARGDSARLDQRTDVYSLGATLYELLTLHRPFDGTDSATVLKRIDVGDYRPPRTWDSAIPVDLENVIVKAMSSACEERYFTARELADDLRRFLEGKPTYARAPTLAKRLSKWTKRHGRAVLMAGLSLCVAVGGILVGWGFVINQSAKTRRALDNLQQAKAAVHQVGSRAAELLHQTPGTEHVRQELLADMLVYHRKFLEQAGDSPSVRHDVALTYAEMAKLNSRLGNNAAALRDYREAARLLRELMEQDVRKESHRVEFARCLNNIGDISRALGQTDGAITALRQAISVQEPLQQQHPGSLEYEVDHSLSWNNLGLVYADAGDSANAVECYTNALRILETVANRDSDARRSASPALASVYNNLSQLFLLTDPRTAIDWCQKAITTQRELVKDSAKDGPPHADLAKMYNNLASLCSRVDKNAVALKAYDEAVKLQRRLADAEPFATRHRQDLAVSLNNRGLMETKLGKPSEAVDSFRQSLGLQQAIVQTFPADLEHAARLGGMHNNLAMAYQRRNELPLAASEFEKGIRYQKYAQRGAPQVARFRENLSRNYFNYVRLLLRLHRPAEAAELALRRRELWPNDPRQLHAVAVDLAHASQQLAGSDPAGYQKCVEEVVHSIHQAKQAGWAPAADFDQDIIYRTLHADERIRALLASNSD